MQARQQRLQQSTLAFQRFIPFEVQFDETGSNDHESMVAREE
jgi:hypothetical protein